MHAKVQSVLESFWYLFDRQTSLTTSEWDIIQNEILFCCPWILSLCLSWDNTEKKGLWPCKLYSNGFWKNNKNSAVCLDVEGLASCLYCLCVAPEWNTSLCQVETLCGRSLLRRLFYHEPASWRVVCKIIFKHFNISDQWLKASIWPWKVLFLRLNELEEVSAPGHSAIIADFCFIWLLCALLTQLTQDSMYFFSQSAMFCTFCSSEAFSPYPCFF